MQGTDLHVDETKPECSRCLKAGYTCAGYDRPLVFRNQSTAPLPIENKIIANGQDEIISMLTRSISKPPPELCLVAFKGDICFAYLFDNFVWRTYGTPWLEKAAHGQLDSLATNSIQALSRAHFGNDHSNQETQIEGSTHYGRALRALVPALANPLKPGAEALIVPMLILLLFSVRSPRQSKTTAQYFNNLQSLHNDREGSVSHVKGLAMLLHVCGPVRFQDPVLRSAFESCRATLVTTALISRQRTFLDEDQWRTIPYALDPSSKGTQSQLVDILVMIPGFLQELDGLRISSSGCKDAQAALLDKILQQLNTIFYWRWSWHLANPDGAWELPAQTICSLTNKPRVFGKVLHFLTLDLATEIMLYNAILLWLLGLAWQLDPDHASYHIATVAQSINPVASGPSDMRGPLHLAGQAVHLRDAALEICRCMEYHIQNIKYGHNSSLFYLFPIGMAWSVLQAEELYKQWIVDMLNSSYITKGYVTGENSCGFGSFYRIPSVTATTL
jgi:hypothetical protein